MEATNLNEYMAHPVYGNRQDLDIPSPNSHAFPYCPVLLVPNLYTSSPAYPVHLSHALRAFDFTCNWAFPSSVEVVKVPSNGH